MEREQRRSRSEPGRWVMLWLHYFPCMMYHGASYTVHHTRMYLGCLATCVPPHPHPTPAKLTPPHGLQPTPLP